MNIERLEHVDDMWEYQCMVVERILKNYYRFYETKVCINSTEIVINKVDIDMALSKLSREEQFIIRHHYIFGYKVTEIALELGMSKGNVSKIKIKAFQKIVCHCLF